ncbi:flagellar hook-length control protein FliK [Pseudotabrizicola sediminis]|uniref:Flagellar hook-length control protein FliK n=2 Tax=Pseudotabrizicola sediminis TaxID=2486418 RepID=A0ABY2KM19_9RHOB|nr:flagellar hook-length control protein FliK [Pseudotabrizicola sediminis]
MQITPFSPPQTSVALAPGDGPGDGATFEKLMTSFRPGERGGTASDQGKGAGAETGTETAEVVQVDPDSVVAEGLLTEPAPAEPAGAPLWGMLAASAQTTPAPWQDETSAPVPTPVSGAMVGSLTHQAVPVAEGVAGPQPPAAATVLSGQTYLTDQEPARAMPEDKPETRLAPVAKGQDTPVPVPPAREGVMSASQSKGAGPGAEAQMAANLAGQPGTGAAATAAGSPEADDLPLNALSAAMPAERALPGTLSAGRRTGSSTPPPAQGADVASGASSDPTEMETGPRLGLGTSASETDRTPQNAKPIKPAEAVAPTAPAPVSPVPMAADFSPDVADPLGLGRDSVAASGSTPQGGGTTGPAVPTPASQISQTILQIIQKGADSPVEVMLRPEELGKIRFDLTTIGDRLHIMLYVERPDAMDLIRRHGEQFLNDLRLSGFGNPSLSFGDWSQRDARPAKAPVPAKPTDGSPAAYDIPAGQAARTVAAGRLDLRL